MIRRTLLLVAVALLGLMFLIALHAWYASYVPRFSDATLRFEDVENPPVVLSMPVWYTLGPLPRIGNVSFNVDLPKRHTPYFLLPHTGNIVELIVNGAKVNPDIISKDPDMGGALRPGKNTVTMRLFFNDPFSGVIVAFLPSLRNFVKLVQVFLQLSIVLFFSFLFQRIRRSPLRWEIIFFVALGITLRCLYLSGTPWYFYGYDSQGHIDYIFYLVNHGMLPAGTALWQAHQAPLYYVLASFFPWIGGHLGWSRELSLLSIQSFSLFLSIGVLFVGVDAVHAFFQGRMQRALGVALLAAAPPLVFLSSQISNDVLLMFFGILWYAALQRSLADRRSRQWILACFWLAFAILTKANAILLFFPTVLAFFFLTPIPFVDRVKRIGFLVLTSPIWASFYFWRFLSDRAYGIVENAHLLSSAGRIDLTLYNLFIFNPVSLFLQPFVHHVSGPFRQEYFLETVLRSFQFGSSVYASFGRYPLLFLLLLLPVGIFGAFRLLQRKKLLPVITTGILMLGLIIFCFRYPYTSSQHFRYIAISTLPIALCVIEGVYGFRWKFLRMFFEVIVLVYVLVTALFYLGAFLSTW
ncbi:hypothetical protein EXS65_04600 [Candidatus Peribacteria bacterium]|nr:hypothetical protein [Candidatus Peribacteria bacterium]